MARACMPLPAPPAAAAVQVAAPSAGGAAAAPPRDAAAGRRTSTTSGGRRRVLVLGGTGRVGGSTAAALSKLRPDLRILVGGRNREKGKSLASRLGNQAEFVQVDIHDPGMLQEALHDVDLVVHAAGPFQSEKCTVLEAAISTKTPYVDVCDDTDYSWRAKGFHEQAKASGVPAIITAGLCPGMMAAELVHAVRSETVGEPERLRFFYYIAGSGGLGPAALTTTFFLLGKDVTAYNKGEEINLKPYSGEVNTDFGKGVGKKDAYLLNLPEVKSAFKVLGVPTVSARFGADPFFWNWGMQACTSLLPVEYLKDKNKVPKLVEVVDPFVRAIDGIAGQCVSMRVDLDCSNGQNTSGLFTHERLSISVGYATSAFVLAILEGTTQPGVWFPEEPEGIAIEARKLFLERATQGTTNYMMNNAFMDGRNWSSEVGLGIYE
ncbi:hypothetical protein ACP4OV_003659 [Aristida adscensionis]